MLTFGIVVEREDAFYLNPLQRMAFSFGAPTRPMQAWYGSRFHYVGLASSMGMGRGSVFCPPIFQDFASKAGHRTRHGEQRI
jgi:hypothetical protein